MDSRLPGLASSRGKWLLAGALLVGTVLLYARVAGHPYLFFDDNRYVTENLTVQAGLTWRGVVWAFTTLHASNWHPLTWLSHMLDVEVFGLNPGAHHMVNVVLHGVDAALLFLVLARMTGAPGRSAFVAALFAVHPTHVESVAWVAERKDVLSTLLGLLALAAYDASARRGGLGRYLGVVGCFALSLLAKPMWVTFPFLLLLLDVWPLQRWEKSPIPADPEPPAVPRWSLARLVLEKIPLLALSAASSVVTVVAQHQGGAVTGLELGLGARVGNAAVSYLRYVGKTVWPWPLAVFYPHPSDGLPAWQAVGGVALIVILSAGAVWASRRMPWLALGWFWFLGTLVPVIGVLQVGAQAMADRYTYLPTIGLYVIVAWAGAAAARRWKRVSIAKGAAIATVVALAVVSWVQLDYWSDHVKLFRHALAVEPPSGIAHGVLSDGLRRAGKLDEALEHAEEAVRLFPGNVRHWNNLGISFRDLKRYAEAREALLEATRVDPSHANSWVNLALVEMDLGRPGTAMAAYERAAALGTTVASAWSNLAVLYVQSGRTAEAGVAFERATQLEPGSASAWFNLGLFRLKAGQVSEAEQALVNAQRLDPASSEIGRRLAEARALRGP